MVLPNQKVTEEVITVREFLIRFFAAEIPVRAAALAYHTLLAIVPILGLLFWYLNTIGVTQDWMEVIKGYVLTHLNVSASGNFLDHFEKLTASVRGATAGWTGIVLLAYTMWSLITKFGDSVDTVLLIGPEQPTVSLSFLKLTLRRLFVMFGLPISLVLSLIVTQWIREDSWLHRIFQVKRVGPLLALPVTWGVDIFALFLIYLFVPRRILRWREAFKAALIVGPALELTRWGVGAFNRYSVSVHKIYGVLAAIPMLVLWIQIAWMIVLAGALFVRTSRISRN